MIPLLYPPELLRHKSHCSRPFAPCWSRGNPAKSLAGSVPEMIRSTWRKAGGFRGIEPPFPQHTMAAFGACPGASLHTPANTPGEHPGEHPRSTFRRRIQASVSILASEAISGVSWLLRSGRQRSSHRLAADRGHPHHRARRPDRRQFRTGVHPA